jgi:hypothetical protein
VDDRFVLFRFINILDLKITLYHVVAGSGLLRFNVGGDHVPMLDQLVVLRFGLGGCEKTAVPDTLLSLPVRYI